MARIFLIIAAVAVLAWYAGNVAQQPSPHASHLLLESDDFIWKTFLQCKVSTGRNLSYRIAYSPEVRAMNGKKVAISGFMVPLEAKGDSGHFLLSRRAPSCPFCPPAEPNELVEVYAAKPLRWQESLVTCRGTLVLPSDPRGAFFQLKDAS